MTELDYLDDGDPAETPIYHALRHPTVEPQWWRELPEWAYGIGALILLAAMFSFMFFGHQ